MDQLIKSQLHAQWLDNCIVPHMETKQQTFKQALRQWQIVRSLGSKKSTVRFYQFAGKVIADNWADCSQDVANISADDVLDFALKVTDYSPSYWNCFVSAIRTIVPQHRNLMKRREMRFKSKVPPNQTEFSALLIECDASQSAMLGPVVRFLALTGLRIGQAKSLRWEHVNEVEGIINVPGQKNGEAHQLPIIDGLYQVLARLRLHSVNGYVLPRINVRRSLANACKRAGVPHSTHHSFRHFFATACVNSGVDITTLANWLSHKDRGATAAKFYFH
ncbi:MAG: tyrosine-type recombinase/integrase, partial [Limisphaerales bacterium]